MFKCLTVTFQSNVGLMRFERNQFYYDFTLPKTDVNIWPTDFKSAGHGPNFHRISYQNIQRIYLTIFSYFKQHKPINGFRSTNKNIRMSKLIGF